MAEKERWNFGPIQIYRESLTYHVSYDRNGVRVRQSLGCTKLALVLRWAACILEREDPSLALETPERRAAIVANSISPDIQEIVRDAVRAEMTKPALKAVAIETALTEYLTYQSGVKGNKRKHVRNVELILRHFTDFAKVSDIAAVTGTHVEGYLASISTLSPKTRKDRRGHISAWLHWAKTVKKYLSENVAESVATPRISKADVTYHTSEEIMRILKAAQGHCKEALVNVAMYTGLRASELFRLEAKDIDYKGCSIRVRKTKTGSNRSVPLMDEIIPLLVWYLYSYRSRVNQGNVRKLLSSSLL